MARHLYNAVLPLAAAGAHIAGRFIPKVGDTIAGNKGFMERWKKASVLFKDQAPVWFHVSSVGEYEQARPVITAMQIANPEIPVAITFSSPSGIRFAANKEPLDGSTNVVFVDYMPMDLAKNMRFCLDVLSPRLVVLVKFDLWPNHIWTTNERGIPIILIDATLSPSSRRLSGLARFLYEPVYRSINKIIAISEADASRFRGTIADHPDISVGGDTRYDRVMERWNNRSGTRFEYQTNEHPVLICGSTWPRDEAHLLPALKRLMNEHTNMRVIIAPHEPTTAHVDPLIEWARGTDFEFDTITGGIRSDARVTVLDTVGVLAEAYRLADIAYIGGSFSTGVHSVIEPAIAGLPTVFGPIHSNSYEALQLLARNAAYSAGDAEGIYRAFSKLLSNTNACQETGKRASEFVISQLGATEKCLEAMAEFL
jgi:3-deoxy-D-manno-octulosonic-acid transferase